MTVYPSLTYEDVEAALEFLERAFGLKLEDVGTDEDGSIRHAAVRCGEGLVLIQPDLPDELRGSHLGRGWVYVEVADPDAHHARAQAAGAEVLGEPHDAMGGTMRATAPAIPRATSGASAPTDPADRELLRRTSGETFGRGSAWGA